MKKLILLSVFALIAGFGCGHKKLTYNNENNLVENEKDGLSVRTLWLKNKKDSIDVLLMVRSGYAENIVLKESSFLIEFGGEKFAVRPGTGDLVMRQGLTYERLLIFKMHKAKPMEGTAVVHIDPLVTESGKKLPPFKLSLGVSR
ncbi:MAG: hypothetical protein KF681_05330 [Bdellovibrionaceae bacterium]|nr:hypothetical protein [Pseudobdellovibrionaceae bacterium]